MPAMPAFADELARRTRESIELARAGDVAAASLPVRSVVRSKWYTARVELLYELAFLRMWASWEEFLEETFIRYLCGYTSTNCTPVAVLGRAFFGTPAQARAEMLRNRSYVLWHNPATVATRSREFLVNGTHELIIESNSARLLDIVSLRHGIVHHQAHARAQVDAATMNFNARRYRGSRPGRFLRDWDTGVTPPRRWLDTFAAELAGLAGQIA